MVNQTIEFVKEHGLTALADQFGIKVNQYEGEGIAVLNYDQIVSPKTHPVVMGCRALILDADTFDVVSASFDRFFNYGEAPEQTDVNIENCIIFEKVDGSLINVYKHNDKWEIATRSTAFGEAPHVMGGTFRERVLAAFGFKDEADFQLSFNYTADPDTTLIYEFIGPDNRHVTRYSNSEMVLLAVRNKKTLSYWDQTDVENMVRDQQYLGLNVRLPMTWDMGNWDDIVAAAKNMTGLEEGFVVYDQVTHNRVKIKSPAYVAVHHLRDNGVLSPKRIAELVVINEAAEYLTYYPEDEQFFRPYIDFLQLLKFKMSVVFEDIKGIESQKEFAIEAMKHPFYGILFEARKRKQNPIVVFNEMPVSKQVDLLLNFKGS